MEIIDSDAAIEPTEQLIDAFTPSDLPPPAPDGGPLLEPAPVRLPVLIDTICDRGPCRHRHLLKVAIEAAEPLEGGTHERPKLGPDGEPIIKRIEPDVLNWEGKMVPGQIIYETEPYTPMTETRICYPAPGVRIELTEDEPVAECSLWDPEDPDDADTRARKVRRLKYEARQKQNMTAKPEPVLESLPIGSAGDVEDLNREDHASSDPQGVKRKK